MSPRKNTNAFLKGQPCCLCGGSVPATTVEHAPPKVFFIDKQVPAATHRVPACQRCNNGSGSIDQVAALTTMVQAIHKDLPEAYIDKLIKGVRNNAPNAFLAIANGNSSEVPLKINETIETLSKVEIGPEIYQDYLNPWAAKQAYALYYLHSGKKILPPTSRVMVKWFTNSNIVDEQSPDNLLRSLLNYGELKQGIRNSESQFCYKWQIEEACACFILMLHDACMVMLGVSHDPNEAKSASGWSLFATNADRGIHQTI